MPQESARSFPIILSLVVVCALLSTGCAVSHRFAVDVVAPSMPAASITRSFRLANANPEAVTAPPGFAVMAGHVRTALSSKGLFEAPAAVTPDIVIEIDYGVDAVGREVHTGAWDTSDPYEPKPVVVTLYDKFLRISAHEPAATPATLRTREVWSVYVTGASEETDLRSFAVLLVSAAMDALDDGENGAHEVVLTARDDRVTFIQRGM